MMLFKPEHVQMILDGQKTQTRRIWSKPRVKVGSIQLAKTKMLSKEYFAKIKIVQVFKQRLVDMTHREVWKEGYNTISDFQEIWRKINGQWDGNKEVYVVEFELIANNNNI